MSTEVEEIGQVLGRSAAAFLSAALITAREAMRKRADRAEAARRAGVDEAKLQARKLEAEREMAAVGWQRLNLAQWFRERPREVAEVWASAATWAPHDERAREALAFLDGSLDRYSALTPEISEAMRESGDYDGLSALLAAGAEEARQRLERANRIDPAEQASDPRDGERARSADTAAGEPQSRGAGQNTKPPTGRGESTETAPAPARLDYEILVSTGDGAEPLLVAGAGAAEDVLDQLSATAARLDRDAGTVLLEYRVRVTSRDGAPPFALTGAGLAPDVASQLRSTARMVGADYGNPGWEQRLKPTASPTPAVGAAPEPGRAESGLVGIDVQISPNDGGPRADWHVDLAPEKAGEVLESIATQAETGQISGHPTLSYSVAITPADGADPLVYGGGGTIEEVTYYLRAINDAHLRPLAQPDPAPPDPPQPTRQGEQSAGAEVGAPAATRIYTGGSMAARLAGMGFARRTAAALGLGGSGEVTPGKHRARTLDRDHSRDRGR